MTWSVLGESVAGSAHRARNIPCQDAFRSRLFGSNCDWLVVAVADGAGSASHSDVGANCACDEFVQRVATRSPDSLSSLESMVSLFTDVRAVIVGEAEKLAVPPRELACTALLAIVGPESVAAAQLGDGAIVLVDGRDFKTAFWPEPAEYANMTDFITDTRFADALRFERFPPGLSEIAILTDGLQRVALDFGARTPHQPFFRPLFNILQTVTNIGSLSQPFLAFLDSPRINERTDDDKTLVLAVCRP
jgi:hypothetical protein